MTASSFLRLADGGEVRFDFNGFTGQGPSSLGYQLLAPDGHAIGPEVTVVSDGMGVDAFTQLDSFNAAALTGGGFVVATEERLTLASSVVPPFEVLKVTAHTAHGDSLIQMVVARDLAPDTQIATPGVFGLSGDTFAVVFERRDSGVVSEHLDLPRSTVTFNDTDPFDLTLPGVPNAISTADGDLTLGFVDGSRVLAGGDVAGALTGGAGNDTIIAGAGGDVVRSGDGNDSVVGGAGVDDLNGNMGSDTVQGGSGNEVVRGGQGNDSISGGAGNDFISGDRGSDSESGGTGADIFHTFSGAGLDRVLDFHLSEGDRVQVDPGTAWTVTQVGADTVIDMGNGDQMVLVGVDMTTLTGNWIFAA
jgi:hypothetical protein